MAKPDGVISLADVVQNNAAPKKRIQDEDGTISLAGLLSTDQAETSDSIKEDRGFSGDVASHVLRGGVQAVKGVGGLMRMSDADPEKDEGFIASTGKKLTEWADKAPSEYDILKPDAGEAKEGFVKRGVMGGFESAAPSVLPLGGAVVGAKVGGTIGGLVGGPPGAIIGGLVGGVGGGFATLFGTFGLGQYQNTYDETKKILINKGVSEPEAQEKAHTHALKDAAWETGGELAGDAASMFFFGALFKPAIKQGVKQTVRQLVSGGGAKEFAKAYFKSAPFEVGSEMGTAYGQTKSANEVGISDVSVEEAMAEAVIPAVAMSLIFGLSIRGMQAIEAHNIYKNLNSKDPKERINAAQAVSARMEDAESQKAWRHTVLQHINAGQEIPLSKPIVDFASQAPDPADAPIDVQDVQTPETPVPAALTSNLSPAEQKKAVIDGFWADLNAPNGMTISEAMEAKRVILQHAPHLEDDINKAIIEAEGNKLFVPEREEVKTQNEDDISDEEYAAKERAKVQEKKISETNKLSTFLRDEGVLVDSFLDNPNNHITYVGKDKNGIYEVRVEEHTEHTVRPTLVTLKKGEDLTDALNKTINPITGTTNLSGQGGIVQPGATSQEAAGTQTGQGIAEGETPRPDSIGQLKADMAKTKDALAGQAQEEFKTSEDVQKAIDNFEDELIKKYGSDAVVKAPLDNKSYTKMGILPPETPLNKNELSRLQGLYAARDKIDAEDLGVWRKAVIEKSGMTEKDTHDALNALHMNVGSQTDVYFTADRLKKWGTGTTGNLKRLYDHFSKDTMADFRIGGTAENPAIQGTVYNREDGRPSTWDKESLKKTEKFFNVIAETQSASPITLSDMGKNKLPAPLSQTDAATVGIAKDEAKSGESLSDIPKIDANHQKDVIKATIRNLREGLKRKESGQYIAKQGSIDGLYDRLKYSISDLRKQGDLDHETIRAIGESGLYDEKYLKEVLPEYEPAPSEKAGTAAPLRPEAKDEISSSPTAPLGDGWESDRGAIPGEPSQTYKGKAAEKETSKKKPKKNIMENAPPGGWTEADKVPEKYRKKAESSKPTVLQGTYTSHGDSMKDIRENGSNTPERKFKADLKAYAKRLQEILGYEPNINTKGKKSTDETVSTNIAPAGGEGHIVLWKPNSDHGIYMTIMVQRDGGNDYAGNFGNDKITIGGSYSDIMYRVATKTDKYGVRGGANQWAKADVSAEELAEKIRNEVDFYENVNGAKEVIKEARHGGNTREEISKAFAEGEAAGEIEGADLTDEQIKSEIADISETLGVEVKLKEESDLSSKSTKELVDDIFSIINDHIGERGSLSNKPVELDESLYQKLKPYLMEIVNRAKAKALDARAYLFGAVDSMPEGKAKEVYEAAANRYINDGELTIYDQNLFDKLNNIEYIKHGEGGNARYERKDSITEKDLDTAQINQRKDSLITAKRDAFREKRAEEAKGEISHEYPTDGSTGTGTLESDESGNLSADGRGQGPGRGERGGSQIDKEGNGSADVDWDVGAGSLAGEPAPIHLQDSGSDSESVPAGSSAVDETPASEPRTLQLSGINPGNYRITEQDDIGSGTRGQRIDRNLAAIRLVKQLDKERRYPTKEEQAILAKYVGWGGLKTVFDGSSSKPQDIKANEELKSLLTKEEYFEARQSILNAHYTSRQVIQSIYKIMRHFGFTGGNIIEPTYGVGNFIGFMPDDMAASSKWYGSELDPITSKIGQFLYPDSQLIHSGFQTAEFPYGKYDAAVGNPPFGDVRIADTRKDRSDINRMKIHNYVISKSGMHLKPGGIMGMVITNRFLDTADPEARDFLSKQFRFLGAIRLPNDAFAKNAGTEVTTDIVFLQRLMPGETSDQFNKDWLETGATMTNKDGETITLNKYFAERPDLMLGEPSMKGTMYGGAWKEGGKGEFTLNKREGEDIEEAIDKIIRAQFFDLKDVAKSNNDKLDAAALSLVPNKEDVAVGGFFMDKDRIYMREDNDEYGNPTYTRLTPKTKWTEKQLLGETRYNRIKGMLEIRAKAYKLINAERFDLDGIEQTRQELNDLYDPFVKEFGFISESPNYSLMSDDIKIEFGLETDFKKEVTRAKAKTLGITPSPASAEKATILKERMFFPEKEILYAKDSADGYNISLSQKGKLDIDYIVNLTGSPKESVINELADEGLIFKDPVTSEWIQEDEYLSGNVKDKYKKVENKAGFEKNAAALKKVLPPDVATEDIFATLGATWIPGKVYEQFGHFIGLVAPSVSVYTQNGQVVMSANGVQQNDINVSWSNPYYSLADVFNAGANSKMLIAWDGTGDDRVQNKEQTKVLGQIVKQMRSTFNDWIFADDTRSKELTKIYNDTQNTHAKRKFSGSHLNPVGATPSIILRNTQRDAAWRIIQDKKVLLDHCVGAGKTYTIITGINERVRMGLTKKAMIVVPNHLVGQWAADYMRLYPGAKILAATKKDFSAPNRRRLFARIATGKYDAIIVGHSSFGFIPLEPEALTNLIQEEIAQLEAAHAQAERAGNKRLIKTLANRIAKKREKINELLGRPRDNVTTFEAMGVDHLVIDESHEFKNLEYSSSMQSITGMGTPMGSKRAFDLYSKIRWLTAQPDYALNFATGTPISNSLVEMYALLRYMNRETLVSRGLEAFDSWAKNYASIESKIEYTASQKLKERTVMSTFNNLPEMLQMYEEFADIVTLSDLKRIYAEQIRERNERTGGNESEDFPIPKVKDGGRTLDVADPSPEQIEYVDYLVARAERLEEEGRGNDPRVDNHLWIMSDARKMALDIRLVDPRAGESPNNKINRASKRIKEIYDESQKDKGAQLVFCDLSTPAKTSQKSAAVFIRDALKKARLDGDARTNAILNSLSTYHEKWGYIRNAIEAEIESIGEHRLAETEQYMKRREELEEYIESVTDEVTAHLTTADTGFSVYDEIKSKLIMMGIPEGEIKFIHDANTEQQKEDLFALVNSGQVRVLLGSSQKMGAGMNVQERLVALHHMDAPWRPSDVEQREGRLVRQGNKLYMMNPKGFLVEIKAYSTANTFDAVMWQILARKGGMLDDFRNGRRSVNEVNTDSSDYSDFMAQSTGNPAFKEKFQLENDIEILEATKSRTATRLRSAQQSLNYNKDQIVEVQQAVEKRDKIVNDLKDQSTFTYEGKEYKDNAKDLIGKAKDEINEHNRKVNNEYQKALEDAINKAFEEKYKNTGWDGAWIIPRYPNADVNSQEMRDYKEAYASYQLFMENEDNEKILADAIKGVKKPLNKHFHADKLAKTDKSGVIAAGLKMVDEINGLDDKESITFMLGSTEIKIKKEESSWTDRTKEDVVELWDFVITADGMFLDRLQHDRSFPENNIWDIVNVEYARSRMTSLRNEALDYIQRMEESDKVSRHTLKSLAFKDNDKLQKMKNRYQEVLAEVQQAEAEISDRRASMGNKYVSQDRERFPAGVWIPQNRHQETVSLPGTVIDENIESIKAKRDKIKKDFNDYNLDATEIADQLYKKSYASLTYKETVQVQDTIAFKHAELARYEAILSQEDDGNIKVAQSNLKAAQDIWNEWHEGEDYPNDIKLARKVINSIRSGQGRLFNGQLYSGLDPTQTLNVLRGLRDNIKEATPHIEAIGRKMWEDGKRNYDSWFLGMKKFLGDLWRSFKPIMRAVWNKLKDERGSISFEKKDSEPKTAKSEKQGASQPIREPQDPPVSKDPKVLNLYLKDETDALVKTIMNKLHPQHMTWLETMLKSPEWFGHEQISNIVRLFMRDRNEIYHETFNELNLADDIDAPEDTIVEAAKALKNKGLSLAERIAGKVSPEYKRLQEIIDEGDTTWKRDTSKPLDEQIKAFEDHIRKQGATDETIRVWKLYRMSYDKALDLQTAQLRRMISDIIEEANFKGETPDLNELKRTLKGALAQMEEWRGFYAPRQREVGGWKVQAYKEHGPLTENREWYRDHRGSELSAQRLANKLKREGWTIYDVGEVERIPETIYQDVNAVATAKLIDAALEKLSKKSDLAHDLTVKFNEEVLREVSDAIKARGFRSTMIHRGKGAVIRGFIEDPIRRHLQYINNLSGGIAKARVARLAMEQLTGRKFKGKQIGGIDPVKEPKAYEVAQNYITEQLRNMEAGDRIIGIAKSIATFKFLGFNVRSLAVNMTAIMTTAPAAIHEYAMGGKGSMFRVMKEIGRAGKDYGAVMAGRKLANANEQAFIDLEHKKGWDDAQYTRDALGEVSKTHSRIWSSMMDGSMYLFGKSERWNRGTTMLAAYRLAIRNGFSPTEAAEKAKDASDKAHGVYGKSTMPMWAQGTNPAAKIGQMMYVYSKFGHNYLQMLYDLGFKRHNIKAAMFAFLSPLVLAGGTALPFKDTIFAFAGVILRSLFGEDKDPEKWVWDIIRQHLGEDAERIGRHGLTGAAGVDISGSLSIGVGIPKNMIELTGAIGGVAVELKEAVENIGRGRYVKAVEHILPSGLANPVRAIRESNEGVSTRNNRRVWDTSGKPYQPSVGETISRAAGFRSTRQAVISERTWEGHREQARYNDARNAIYEQYRAWLLGGRDPEEHKAITKKVREYNNGIKEVDGVSRITFESLRRQAKGLKKPTKKERAILQ